MKKYYFANFTVVAGFQSFNHMSVFSTEKEFFPLIQAKNKVKTVFDQDIGQETNVIFNTFQEVTKESFDEFHKDSVSDFAEL